MLESVPHIEFIKGFDSETLNSLKLDKSEKNLMILDDQQADTSDLKIMTKLFTQGSHHLNLTIIYIIHNLFDQGKSSRTVALNAHYIVLFKNPADNSQVQMLCQRRHPKSWYWLHRAFLDATKSAYGYLIFDNRPEIRNSLRYRTGIKPDELLTIYRPDYDDDNDDEDYLSDFNDSDSE